MTYDISEWKVELLQTGQRRDRWPPPEEENRLVSTPVQSTQ